MPTQDIYLKAVGMIPNVPYNLSVFEPVKDSPALSIPLDLTGRKYVVQVPVHVTLFSKEGFSFPMGTEIISRTFPDGTFDGFMIPGYGPYGHRHPGITMVHAPPEPGRNWTGLRLVRLIRDETTSGIPNKLRFTW